MTALGSMASKEGIKSRKAPNLLLALLIFSVCISSVAAGADVGYVNAQCNVNSKDPDNSNFYYNVDAVFHNLLTGINVNTGRWHAQSDNENDGDTAYGLASCFPGTSENDCRYCLNYAINNYFYEEVCPITSAGVQVTLGSCFLEYENYYVE